MENTKYLISGSTIIPTSDYGKKALIKSVEVNVRSTKIMCSYSSGGKFPNVMVLSENDIYIG